MKVLVSKFEKGLYFFTRQIDRISWAVLFLLMLMTVTQVFLRKLTNHAILGTVELTELAMAFIVFCSLAECQVHEGHIKVDLVLSRFSPRVQSFFDILTQGASFVIFTLMTVALFRQADELKRAGEITVDLGIPMYPFVYVAAFGCILLALVLLVKALLALTAFLEVKL
jgi:TRAP-type C4-dicarboxylate transport system permease small subunit